MKKVLVVGGMKGSGGISTYIYRTFTKLASSYDYEIVFIVEFNNSPYIKKIKDQGFHIIYIPNIKTNPLKSLYMWVKYLWIYRKYDIIHFHKDSLKNWIPIFIAKLFKMKHIIIQSHNSQLSSSKRTIDMFFNSLGKIITCHLCDKYIAVSDLAGKYMFNERVRNSNKYLIIKNGVDVNRFSFNEDYRNEIREKFNMEGKFVVGNIGRLCDVKNQNFLIDIFKKISILMPNSYLLMIGEGDIKPKLIKKIKQYGISDRVLILPNQKKIEKFYSAMDVFVFPSLFEGYPMVLAEAQSTGLPVIASDTITKEIKILNSFKFISLKLSDIYWAKYILKLGTVNAANRKSLCIKSYIIIKKLNFDSMIKKIHDLYQSF